MKFLYFFIPILVVAASLFANGESSDDKFLIAHDQETEFLRIRSNYPQTGMFACGNLVLGNLMLYEAGYFKDKISGFKIDFGTKGAYYDPDHGPNWWEYYFEPIELGTAKNSKSRFSTKAENYVAWDLRYSLTREQAHELITKYVKVKKFIRKKVDAFAKKHFTHCSVIGVHYRGTDKSVAAPRVRYSEAIRVVKNNYKTMAISPVKIFVATDEEEFLETMKKTFPGQVIATDAIRTDGKVGVHQSDNDRYLVGEQGLIDCLLLSKCDLLIRTSSNVSLWSSYFNPKVPVIMLSHKHKGPE